jgi:tetratricopeptide (TPR) repeat protein
MKLRVLFFALVCMGFSLGATAQGTPTKQHYLDLYKRAIKYNDTRTAITALNGYLSLGEDAAYRDTLAMVYYLSGEYVSSLLLTKEVCEADPKNLNALERLASCYSQLGDLKATVENYEKLVPQTRNPYHHYQLALAQYQLKRVAECQQNLQYVVADTSSKNIQVSFNVSEGQVQNVPLLAAAYNMAGVIFLDNKNYAEARKYLTKAIETFPQFVGARQNLEVVNRAGGAGRQPAKPKGKG